MSRRKKQKPVGKRIVIIVEGATERAFKPVLLTFLESKLQGRMPKLDFQSYDGRIPKGHKLRFAVENYLYEGADAVIALTDVYTGTEDFTDATDAKDKMRRWVGEEPRFYPHAAQHDFEAWLLPFLPTIEELAGRKLSLPSGGPEKVNHKNPPAHRLKTLFQLSKKRLGYSKTRDAKVILEKNQGNLLVAINACPELKSFINSILAICGCADEELIP